MITETIIPQVIYALCALTSLTCAVMLVRGYLKSRTRILFWASICFVCLALNNALLYLDLIVFPDLPIVVFRVFPGVIGLAVFIYGLIWDTV